MGAGLDRWNNAATVVKSFDLNLNPSDYRGFSRFGGVELNGDGTTFQSISGTNSFYQRNCGEHYYQAYRDCAPLQAIINKLAQAAINGKIALYNRKGKGKEKIANGDIATKIMALMDNPNPLQTGKEFRAQAKIYQKTFGFNLLFVLKPVGFASHEAEELWNIPLNMLDIKERRGIPIGSKLNPIESITLKYGGEQMNLPVEHCFIMKDFTPSFDTVLLPESRQRALSQQIHNTQQAYNIRGSINEDRGALGIISSKASDAAGRVPWTGRQKEEFQNDYAKYGLLRGKLKFILTNVALEYQSIGYPTKDLMLFEEVDEGIQRMCDSYGFPYRLLASPKAASYNDVNQFTKALYQDTIIPDANADEEFWDRVFDTEKYNLEFDTDFSHVPILQEDRLNAAKERRENDNALLIEWKAGKLTLNEWAVALGEEPRAGDEFNLYKPNYDKWLADNGFAAQGDIIPIQDNQNNVNNG